ncbi:hypothetical protein [Candidatus Harpocratesius sp.]
MTEENTSSIYESIMQLFQELHFPLSMEIKEELRNLDLKTLLRVKTLFIGVKSLLEIHEKLQLEIETLRKKNENTAEISNMMDQLAENLRKLEETRMKELMGDLITRFLNSNVPPPRDIALDEVSFTNISNLLEFLTPSVSSDIDQSKLNQDSQISTIVPNNEELARFQIILSEKDKHITKLELEIQAKIRELEALKSDLNRFQELDEEVHTLRARNAELEKEFEAQKTENSILINENKLFQTRFQEISEELDKKNNQLAEIELSFSELEDLKLKITQLEQENSQLKEEKSSLHSILGDLQSKNEQISHELDEIHIEFNNLQHKYDELQRTGELKENRIQELQKDLQDKQQECSHLRESLEHTKVDQSEDETDFRSQLEEKEIIINDLKQELHELNEKIQKMIYRDEFEDLSRKFQETENQIAQKDQYLRDKTEEIRQMQHNHQIEKENLIKKIEELQQKIAEHKNLEELIREKDTIIEDLQKQEEEFHDALLENVKITAEKEELNEKIAELISQKEVLFDRISELKRENSGNLAIIQRLTKQVESLEEKYQKAQEPSPEMIKDTIEKEYLQKQVDSLNMELREQIALASESSGKYQVMKDQYDLLKKEIKDLQDQFDEIRQENLNLQRRIQEQKVDYSEKISDLEQKLRISERKVGELETQLLKAQSGLEYQEEIEKLRKNLDNKNQENQNLEDEISKIRAELALGKKEIARLNEEIVNYRRRIKVLRRDLSSSSSE